MKENTANNTKKISALDINKVKMKKFDRSERYERNDRNS